MIPAGGRETDLDSTAIPFSAGAPTKLLFRNMLTGSGIYSIPLMAQRLISILLLPLVTRFLMPSDYGLLDYIEQISSVLALLLGASFSSAIGYFYFKAGSNSERWRVTTTTIVGSALLGILAAAACWPFAGFLANYVFRNHAAVVYLYVVFITMPPTFLLEALLAWLRVENRPGVWLWSSLLRLGITAVAVALFVAVFRFGVLGVQYAALAATAIPATVLTVFCFARRRPSFDAWIFFRMARFAIPLGLSGLGMFIIHFGDRFVLQRYVTFAELGLYAIAYKIGMLISAAFASFQIYWTAQAYGIMRREDADEVFGRVLTYVVAAIAFCGLGIVACSRPALRLLASPAYYSAAALIPLLALAYCVRSVGEFFRCLFLVEGRPGHDAACTWISCCVCLAGYLILIPRLGVWGAAIATTITFFVFTAIILVWTWRLRPYTVEHARLAKVILALAGAGTPYFVFPVESLGGQIAWGSLLIGSFPLLLWLMRFPTPGERQALRSAASGIWRRMQPANDAPLQ